MNVERLMLCMLRVLSLTNYALHYLKAKLAKTEFLMGECTKFMHKLRPTDAISLLETFMKMIFVNCSRGSSSFYLDK